MAAYDWNILTEKMIRYLRTASGIGMKWCRTEEELKAIPKIRILPMHQPPCVTVSQAYQFGWTVASISENYHADYCRAIHGLADTDDRFYSGGMFGGVWLCDEKEAGKHNEALECVPPVYYGIACSPLSSGRIPEPDVCVLYLSSAQAFMLYAGWQYGKYEKLQFTFAGESTCSDSWCHTKNTGKPGFAIPSFADRKFGAVGEWEVRCTFTPVDLVRAIEGIEALHKNGLRYPIASYSLTTDILAGLPEHYADY